MRDVLVVFSRPQESHLGLSFAISAFSATARCNAADLAEAKQAASSEPSQAEGPLLCPASDIDITVSTSEQCQCLTTALLRVQLS